MLHQALANGTDLTTWASTVESRSTLPLLLRQLIHATTKDITHIGFPAGDAVQFAGWDGLVVTQSGNAFVPAGCSAWEMGTNSNIKHKADTDYAKRTANPLGVNPASATFVFVTPRWWAKKDDWVTAKKAEGVWQDVRVYDASSLEEWLGLAPSVHIWLSKHIGKMPAGVTDLGSFWADWSECTVPALTPTLVLAGRKETQEAIVAWLGDAVPSISVRAEARDEALAVFAATIMELPDDVQVAHLSKAVVVRSVDAWNQLLGTTASLLLLPMFDDAEAIVRAQRGGHRVVIGLGKTDGSSAGTVEVPPLDAALVQKELFDGGLLEDRARELAYLAKRSITSFRRRMGRYPEFQVPGWARPEEAPSIVPFLLAGAWNGASEKDRAAIEALSSKNYIEVAALLTRWSVVSDPPVRSVGDTWYLLSKDDAWRLLARYITRDHLIALDKLVQEEVGMLDTRLDLPPDERWRAQNQPGISKHLREGLVESLIILATRNDTTGGKSGREHVNSCVWNLLQRANADWRLWAALPLRLLAEAAPEVFLEAVDEGLQGPDPVIMKLFEQGDSLFSTAPHTELLWALEIVAWSPEYLGQATHVLGQLARLDPGGRTSNRPFGSLEQIFLFWHPQTSAPFEQRLALLEALGAWEPDVAWRLYCELLPTGQGIGHQNPTPRWRDWAPLARPTSYSRLEYYNGVCAVVRLMLSMAENDAHRWKDLVDHLSDLPPDLRENVSQALKAVNVTEFDDPSLAVVWNSLRSLISKHRSFSEAGWSLAAEVVDDLELVYERFKPQDLFLQHAWLFDSNPDLLKGREQDWREHERIIGELRLEALRAIENAGGLEAIVRFAKLTSFPWAIGTSLGLGDLLAPAAEDELLKAHLASEDQDLDLLARGFVIGRVRRSGDTWWRAVVARLWMDLAPKQQAHFLLQLPEDHQTFDLAETTPETEAAYWSECFGRFVEPTAYERAIRQLFKHRRPFTAIERLDVMIDDPKPSARFIADALRMMAAAEAPCEKPSNLFTYRLNQLFSRIEKSPDLTEDELANLEWALLPALDRSGHDRPPRILQRLLNRSPAFLVELVSLVYKAEGDEDRELDPQAKAHALHAYQLLRSWDTLPGEAEAGNDVDGDYLLDWVRQARDGLAQVKRLTIGDITLGGMLAKAPQGSDGIWPHPAARKAIETVRSAAMEKGFRTAIFNSRGIYSKGLIEGGEQERALAAKYQGFADSLIGTAPRTAACLRRIAQVYQGDARQEDVEAELRDELGI